MEIPKRIAAFIVPIMTSCAPQFPRKCGNCGKVYNDFGQFCRETRPLGQLQNMVLGGNPLGLVTFADCGCGSTMALECTDKEAHDLFSRTLKEEAERTKQDPNAILIELRKEVRRRASV